MQRGLIHTQKYSHDKNNISMLFEHKLITIKYILAEQLVYTSEFLLLLHIHIYYSLLLSEGIKHNLP